MGQQITWVQPYKFNQRLPFDVDYKVMGTFLEFYQSLLKFINFKLFSDVRLPYPLKEMNPTCPETQFLQPAKVKQMQQHVSRLFQ